MWPYWKTIFVKAFWDSLLFFDENPRLLLIFLLAAAVTALLVLLVRGKEAFIEHIKANVAISMGGAVLTWVLMLPYFVARAPMVAFSSVEARLRVAESEARGAYAARDSSDLRLKENKKASAPAPKCPPIVGSHTSNSDTSGLAEELKEQKLQREKRRDERAKIAIFLSQGLALQQRCLSMQVDNSVFQDGNEWSKNTYHYLLTIDPSFSARFDASQGNNYSHGATVNGTYVPMPAGNDDEWNFLNKRMDTLKKLLEELKD